MLGRAHSQAARALLTVLADKALLRNNGTVRRWGGLTRECVGACTAVKGAPTVLRRCTCKHSNGPEIPAAACPMSVGLARATRPSPGETAPAAPKDGQRATNPRVASGIGTSPHASPSMSSPRNCPPRVSRDAIFDTNPSGLAATLVARTVCRFYMCRMPPRCRPPASWPARARRRPPVQAPRWRRPGAGRAPGDASTARGNVT